MKIGIFGGSFDPIHKGHIHFARRALRELRLDKVYFVPAKISPLKNSRPAVSSVDRVKMVQGAIKTEPRFKIDTCELKREGPSYSYLTLRAFRKKFPKADLFFLLGDDAFKTFKQWENYQEILKLSTLVVGPRVEIRDSALFARTNRALSLISKMLPYSSTEIRAKLKEGRSIRRECPPVVCSYIRKNKLYV